MIDVAEALDHVAPSIAAASSTSWLMFCRPPRKISIIVPLVVQIVIVITANIATDGPLSHSHHDSSKTSPLSHDGSSSRPKTPNRLWSKPVRLVEPVDVVDRQDRG